MSLACSASLIMTAFVFLFLLHEFDFVITSYSDSSAEGSSGYHDTGTPFTGYLVCSRHVYLASHTTSLNSRLVFCPIISRTVGYPW